MSRVKKGTVKKNILTNRLDNALFTRAVGMAQRMLGDKNAAPVLLKPDRLSSLHIFVQPKKRGLVEVTALRIKYSNVVLYTSGGQTSMVAIGAVIKDGALKIMQYDEQQLVADSADSGLTMQRASRALLNNYPFKLRKEFVLTMPAGVVKIDGEYVIVGESSQPLSRVWLNAAEDLCAYYTESYSTMVAVVPVNVTKSDSNREAYLQAPTPVFEFVALGVPVVIDATDALAAAIADSETPQSAYTLDTYGWNLSGTDKSPLTIELVGVGARTEYRIKPAEVYVGYRITIEGNITDIGLYRELVLEGTPQVIPTTTTQITITPPYSTSSSEDNFIETPPGSLDRVGSSSYTSASGAVYGETPNTIYGGEYGAGLFVLKSRAGGSSTFTTASGGTSGRTSNGYARPLDSYSTSTSSSTSAGLYTYEYKGMTYDGALTTMVVTTPSAVGTTVATSGGSSAGIPAAGGGFNGSVTTDSYNTASSFSTTVVCSALSSDDYDGATVEVGTVTWTISPTSVSTAEATTFTQLPLSSTLGVDLLADGAISIDGVRMPDGLKGAVGPQVVDSVALQVSVTTTSSSTVIGYETYFGSGSVLNGAVSSTSAYTDTRTYEGYTAVVQAGLSLSDISKNSAVAVASTYQTFFIMWVTGRHTRKALVHGYVSKFYSTLRNAYYASLSAQSVDEVMAALNSVLDNFAYCPFFPALSADVTDALNEAQKVKYNQVSNTTRMQQLVKAAADGAVRVYYSTHPLHESVYGFLATHANDPAPRPILFYIVDLEQTTVV